MADSEEFADLDVPRKSKLPLVLGVVSALLLGGAGGFGASMMMGGEEGAEESAEAKVDPETGEAIPEEPSDERSVVELGQIRVNLRGSGGGRVVQMDVHVEASTSFQTSIEGRKAELRDSIITVVSDYSYADLEGLDGKTRLRDELLERLNGLMEPERIDRVYFNAFVVQ